MRGNLPVLINVAVCIYIVIFIDLVVWVLRMQDLRRRKYPPRHPTRRNK